MNTGQNTITISVSTTCLPVVTQAVNQTQMYEPLNLVTSSHVLLFSIQVNALSNVMRLLLQSHQHIAGLVVKACRSRQMIFCQLFYMSVLKVALESPLRCTLKNLSTCMSTKSVSFQVKKQVCGFFSCTVMWSQWNLNNPLNCSVNPSAPTSLECKKASRFDSTTVNFSRKMTSLGALTAF